jgi:hypothetical protein
MGRHVCYLKRILAAPLFQFKQSHILVLQGLTVDILSGVCLPQRQVIRRYEDLVAFLECMRPAVLVGLCDLQCLSLRDVAFEFDEDISHAGGEGACVLSPAFLRAVFRSHGHSFYRNSASGCDSVEGLPRHIADIGLERCHFDRLLPRGVICKFSQR